MPWRNDEHANDLEIECGLIHGHISFLTTKTNKKKLISAIN